MRRALGGAAAAGVQACGTLPRAALPASRAAARPGRASTRRDAPSRLQPAPGLTARGAAGRDGAGVGAGEAGRRLWMDPVQARLRQGQRWGCAGLGSGCLQGWTLPRLSGQPVAVFDHSDWKGKEVLSYARMRFPVLRFVPVGCCAGAGHRWEESGSRVSTPPLGRCTHG